MKIGDVIKDPNLKKKEILKKLIEHFCGLTLFEIEKNEKYNIEEEKMKQIIKAYNECVYENKFLRRILGKIEIYGLEFQLTDDTYIKMGKEEIVIDAINKQLCKKNKINIFDIGTGTGVLGTTLAYLNKEKTENLLLSDINEKALKIAELNSHRNLKKTGFNKKTTQSNLLDFFFDSEDIIKMLKNNNEVYNILIANLPFEPNYLIKQNFCKILIKNNPINGIFCKN